MKESGKGEKRIVFDYLCSIVLEDKEDDIQELKEKFAKLKLVEQNDFIELVNNTDIFATSCEKGKLEVAKWLQRLVGVNIACSEFNSPFERAKEGGHKEIIKWLEQVYCQDKEVDKEVESIINRAYGEENYSESSRLSSSAELASTRSSSIESFTKKYRRNSANSPFTVYRY